MPQSPLRRRTPAPYSTLTHYLAADGVLDVLVTDGMVGVDTAGSEWWLLVGIRAGVPTNFYRLTYGFGAGFRCLRNGSYMSWEVSGGTAALAAGTPDVDSLLVGTADRTGGTTGITLRRGASETSDTDSVGGGILTGGSYYMLTDGGAKWDAGGVYWWALSAVGPDADQRARLIAGEAPWDVLGGANLHHCYAARDAYEDGGAYYIRDLAPLHGGLLSAAPAEIRNGDLADILEAA